MLYTLTVSVKNRETWKVPAETAEELQALLGWKFEELGPDRASLVRWIEVEASVLMQWPIISRGSADTWTVSIDRIGNGGKFRAEFHVPEAFDDGYRQFLTCLLFLTKLVSVHRKASTGQEHVRKHRYDAAMRMFSDCQELASSLLFVVTRISP